MVRRVLMFLLFLFILNACSTSYSSKEIRVQLENKSISLSERLKLALTSEHLNFLGLDSAHINWLQTYYLKNQYKTLWISDELLNEKGVELSHAISRSVCFSIPPNRILFAKTDTFNIIEQEVLLTANISLIINDLSNGYVDFNTGKYKPKKFVSSVDFDALILKMEKKPLIQLLLDYNDADSAYHEMMNALNRFCSKYPLDSNRPLQKEFVLGELGQVLVDAGYLEKGMYDSLVITETLKIFQIQHGLTPNGQLNDFTRKALSESNYDKAIRTCITLDKMRQQKIRPAKYIRINIPEYKLYFVNNNQQIGSYKLIVGKPENPTPILESAVKQIVIYPYWTVPHSICAKEILPILKKNRNYLTKNHFKLYKKGHRINPYNVNWKRIPKNTFPYRLVQSPGKKNSLGILKFEFQNNYRVYVHDTPSKNLFKSDVRAFSHGCMRCENPLQLAKLMLTHDSVGKKGTEITPHILDSLLQLKKNHLIPLVNQIPIFTEYKTVYMVKGQLVFGTDIYNKDDEYISLFKK
jgi:murein L,D-transpeptidase YcbB/YkuD